MTYMNQGDLFNLILDLKFETRQKTIAEAIYSSACNNDLSDDELATRISHAKKGRGGKPYDNIIGSTTDNDFVNEFFKQIFAKCDLEEGASPDVAREKFEAVKNYLRQKQLCFCKMEELISENAPCDKFIKQMILEAFKQHLSHAKDSVSAGAPDNGIPYVSAAKPSLHPQRIYCSNTFFGRSEYLEKMHDLMKSYKLVVLNGIGGIGKTCLSRQYAYQFASEYSCEQSVTYDKEFNSFEKTILSIDFDGLNDSDISDKDKFEKRMALLRSMSGDILLILDNVDSKPADFNSFTELCINSEIHILVTTRLNDCFPTEQTITVLPMSLEEQLAFFKYHYKETLEESDLAVIKEILEYIGGHTLLIELVAKSMYAGALSPIDMLAYLKGENNTTLVPVSVTKDNLSPEKKTMHDFVKLLFDMRYLNPSDKEAMLYLSLLPVEGVNRRFFYNLMPKFKTNFNELVDNSWAIEENNTLRLHPVIRDMIRKELKPSFRNCAFLLQNLHSLLQTGRNTLSDNEKTDVCKILRSTSEIRDFYENFDNIATLSEFANFCYSSYDYPLALDLYKKTAEFAKDGPIPTMTTIQLEIGKVYKRLAMLPNAIDSYKEALESNSRQQPCREKALLDSDIHLLLSDTYRKNGQYDLAMESNKTAEDIYGLENTDFPLKLGEIYNRRGIILLNMADAQGNSPEGKQKFLEEALVNYKLGLDIRLKNNDSNEQLAYSYHNIGSAYNKLGYFDSAKQNHEKALKLRLQCENKSKTDIASSYLWIGKDCMELGNAFMDIAKENLENSLKIREEILGKSHPEVAWSLISLCEWHEKSHNISKALNLAERALKIRAEKYVCSHEYVLAATQLVQHLCDCKNH